jgi:hypothetical protein
LFSAILFIAVERPFLELRERYVGRRSLAGAPAAVQAEPALLPVNSGSISTVAAAEQSGAVESPAAMPPVTPESYPIEGPGTSEKG